jgi:hypothetical protein
MGKALSIALGVAIALMGASAAQAGTPERPTAERQVALPSAPSSGQQIVAQERGRRSDPRLFTSSGPAPVQVVGPADGFDVRDAAIGGAAVLAFSLLVAAGLVLVGGRRTQPRSTVTSET